MFLISVLEAINIQTIFLFTPKNWQSQFGINDQVLIFAITPGVALFVINYFMYVKRIPKIVNTYKDESEKRRAIGVILLLAYSIVTFLLIFTAFNFKN